MSNDLFESAMECVEVMSNADRLSVRFLEKQAAKAINLMEKVAAQRANEKLVSVARDFYSTEDLKINDDALTSPGEDGVWIQAWVWVGDNALPNNDLRPVAYLPS